jgi:hypothetical protein
MLDSVDVREIGLMSLLIDFCGFFLGAGKISESFRNVGNTP